MNSLNSGDPRDPETGQTGPLDPGRTLDAGGPNERTAGTVRPPGDQWVGPYRLLEVIGEGGFGVVWLAERREPMVQRVALKIIKPGMDSRAVVARFEQERQALAVMDHPHVARVYDGGVTERGLPYFVMEYVSGKPITAFCDEHRYSIRQRLDLFVTVCEAVQHAHMKGIIHRDLKPSNVLVEEVDGRPVVKVIDFGIAKAIGAADAAETLFTQAGQLIGTPEYMSPEQAAGALDIDTRTDVYSLGVMLYELLVGRLPVDAGELRKHAMDEIRRIIREQDAPRPSTRLSAPGAAGDGAEASQIAERRVTTAHTLVRELRRELEWIPLKALRKERDRRYAGPGALADDVRRYLDGRPLIAAPESRAYVLRKFVRRNRGAVAAGAALALVLAGGILISSIGFSRAMEERRVASIEARTAKAALDVIDRDIFGGADPEVAGPETRLSDTLLSARDRMAVASDLPAVVRARVTRSLGTGLLATGLPSEALALLEEAKSLYGPSADPVTTADLESRIAECRYRLLRGDEATEALRKAITDAEARLGPTSEGAIRLRHQLAGALKWSGRLDEAEAVYREVLDARVASLGPRHVDVLICRHNLALVTLARAIQTKERGQAEVAKRLAMDALAQEDALLVEFGPIRAESRAIDAQWQAVRAEALAMRVRLRLDQDALAQYRSVLDDVRSLLGIQHWRVVDVTVWCARLLARHGRHMESAELYVLAVACAQASKGPSDPYTTAISVELAEVVGALGQDERAKEIRDAASGARR